MKDFDISIQFCLAHLIRDIQFLAESHDKSISRYGKKLLDAVRELFHTIHLRDQMTLDNFNAALELKKKALIKAGTAYV
ncbi:MAG: IS66 family transposase, partial [Chitinivibrionales bacterium]|nr:IS66 family transposase [Chitinivibrionales bacterium]